MGEKVRKSGQLSVHAGARRGITDPPCSVLVGFRRPARPSTGLTRWVPGNGFRGTPRPQRIWPTSAPHRSIAWSAALVERTCIALSRPFRQRACLRRKRQTKKGPNVPRHSALASPASAWSAPVPIRPTFSACPAGCKVNTAGFVPPVGGCDLLPRPGCRRSPRIRATTGPGTDHASRTTVAGPAPLSPATCPALLVTDHD